jgi:hypothetical protein
MVILDSKKLFTLALALALPLAPGSKSEGPKTWAGFYTFRFKDPVLTDLNSTGRSESLVTRKRAVSIQLF